VVTNNPSHDELADLPNAPTNDQLNRFIASRLPKTGHPLAEAARHHFSNMGKMLRARMALKAGYLLDVDQAAALHWAIAVEMMHNASLIHDDICDGDLFRRGRPTVSTKFGSNVALALGDWLVALSFEIAAEAAQRSQTPMLVKILATHMKTTTLGQASEFDIQRSYSWQNYLQISANKTAPLLSAPLDGILTMSLHGDVIANIASYFRRLGIAYQIANDILNILGNDGAEATGSDLRRRAPNAVIVIYREELDDPTKDNFDSWFLSRCNVDLETWQRKISDSSAMHIAAKEMLAMLQESERLITSLPVELTAVINPVHQMLRNICQKQVTAMAPHLVVST
jgi:geranylgeranyl pyrophosphate synthase